MADMRLSRVPSAGKLRPQSREPVESRRDLKKSERKRGGWGKRGGGGGGDGSSGRQ